MGESAATLVIGRSIERAADLLREQTGVPDYRFAGLIGLDDCDAFTQALAEIAGLRRPPPRFARDRAQLKDAMVDCQFQFGGARVAIAGDADLSPRWSDFFDGMGVEVVAAVASARADQLSPICRSKASWSAISRISKGSSASAAPT